MIGDLETALWIILENEDIFYDHIVEVGSNIEMSLPAQYVRNINDVAAIDGRIRRSMRGLTAGSIMWGDSRHSQDSLLLPRGLIQEYEQP